MAPVTSAGPAATARSDLGFIDPAWRFSPLAASGFAILAFALSFPGQLNGDTLFSLLSAATPGSANNWHSATLAWLWQLPAPLLGQPAGALAVQAVLFGLFAGMLPRWPATARGRAVFGGELLLRVALAGAAGYVGKDAAILLLLALAVQLLRRRATGPLGRGTTIGLVGVGALFLLIKAPNFLTIVAALALVLPFFVRLGWRYAGIVVAAFALGSLAVPLNRLVDARIFQARDLHPDKQLVLFDLAGISVRTGHNAFADVAGWPSATLRSPAACYVPYMWDSFAHYMPCGGYATTYDRFDGALTRQWLRQIARHPLAYAEHRLSYAGWLLWSSDHDTWGIAGRSSNDATDPVAMATLRQGMSDLGVQRGVALWRPSPLTPPFQALERVLFRFPGAGFVGFFACLAAWLAQWLRRARGVSLGAVLAASLGAGNAAMLLVCGVADPARYMMPTLALAYVALLAGLAPPRRTVTTGHDAR